MPSTMLGAGYRMVYKIDIVHAIMEHEGKYRGEVENTVKEIHQGILIAWAQVRAVPAAGSGRVQRLKVVIGRTSLLGHGSWGWISQE